MAELRQRSLLSGKAVTAGRREPGITQHFHSNQASEIRPFSKVDDGHTAFAEHVLQAVGTELLGGRNRSSFDKELICNLRSITIQQRGVFGIFLQHGQDIGHKGGIVAACSL